MDNGTYEGLDLTPVNTDETYSRLRATQTNNKLRYEPQRRANIDESTTKGATYIGTKDSKISTKFNVVLTIVLILIAVLLLFTLMSIALSVTTYNQLISQQSRVLQQINSTNNKISELKEIFTTQYNESQNDIQTQLAATQTNISSTLTQLDDRFRDSIVSVLHTHL